MARRGQTGVFARTQMFIRGFEFEKRSDRVKACVCIACFHGKSEVSEAFSKSTAPVKES